MLARFYLYSGGMRFESLLKLNYSETLIVSPTPYDSSFKDDGAISSPLTYSLSK